MARGRNFYYGSDACVVAGSANFAARIAASAESFGIPVAMAEEYQLLDATLQEAYRIAKTPETRTSVAVCAKDEALRIVQRRAAALAGIAIGNETVTDAQLIDLGLQPRPSRAERHAPDTPPTVEIERTVGRTLTVRIHGYFDGKTRLADGAAYAEVFWFIGDAPPSNQRLYTSAGIAFRQRFAINLPSDTPVGAQVWVVAAWASRRAKRGPGSTPVCTVIQPGGSIFGTNLLAT